MRAPLGDRYTWVLVLPSELPSIELIPLEHFFDARLYFVSHCGCRFYYLQLNILATSSHLDHDILLEFKLDMLSLKPERLHI